MESRTLEPENAERARAGNPNGRGLARWPAVNDASAAPMILGEINDTPDQQRFAVYDKLYARSWKA